jgi:peptidoglycan/LPS O-acetylase OafA/YrhL
MQYRAEIDGLRALAVVPVILFHAGFELFSGGYVGVDVFFVISGFLITTILIEDIENKRFSIVNFYERRARRILPALFFVMLVCIPFAWMLLPEAALNKFGNGLIGVSLFLSNVVFWRQQGYFDESAELNPILHTWSLAVEEQYYVLFPIFLILAWRFGKNRVFWMLVVMAAVSLLLSEWGWRNSAVANFYLAPTRAWELFTGSIAAFVVQKQGVRKNNLLALFGLAAILFSIFFYDKATPFPSVYALAPVLGVVLLVIYADRDTFAAKLLSTKGFVGLGLISYSAYLWHQPLYAFFRVYNKEVTLNSYASLGFFVLSLVLAYLSWRFIEKPFRCKTNFSKLSIFSLGIGSLLLIYAFGYATKQAYVGGEYRLAYDLSNSNYVYFENLDERKFIEGRLIYPLSPVDTVVVGSSRVMQINSSVIGDEIQSFTVSGASVEDDIAFGLEALAKLHYENIYISADPWLLNRNDGQNRYQSVEDLYSYWATRMRASSSPKPLLNNDSRDVSNSSNKNYFRTLRSLIAIDNRNNVPSHGEIEAIAKKAYDGSHIYNEGYAKSSNENISTGFRVLLNYAMDDFEYDDAISNFESFVSYLKKNGVNVTLVLSPYHPKLYQLMQAEKPIFLEIESWFRDFSNENGIQIIGSYDGRRVGCGENEFYDGMHPKGSCMVKLLSNSK